MPGCLNLYLLEAMGSVMTVHPDVLVQGAHYLRRTIPMFYLTPL